MNGRAWNTKWAAGSRYHKSGNRIAIRFATDHLSCPCGQDGRASVENICVCTEARLYFFRISGSAGLLACSFEEHSFSVSVKFGRVVEDARHGGRPQRGERPALLCFKAC